jgi:GT2 family glycosyltransferase
VTATGEQMKQEHRQAATGRADVGIVVIGRNEGERLVRSLRSVQAFADHVVYVDSGSTDGSIAAAGAMGIDVLNLDMSEPFTAARARNQGYAKLRARWPDLSYVQFVDGDCEIAPGWLEAAAALLDERPDLGVVCGRRREQRRNATVYNRLCDMDWDRPAGVVTACGGDMMVRRSVLDKVGGYDETFVAGEDPELCVRISHAGNLLYRLAIDMTYHDAAMTRFSQWWKRTRRSGWAYAAGAARHGSKPGRPCVAGVVRAVWWGLVLPMVLLALCVAAIWYPLLAIAAALGVMLYLTVLARTFRWRVKKGDSLADAGAYAFFCVIGKPAEGLGVAQYWSQRVRRQRARIIEYK